MLHIPLFSGIFFYMALANIKPIPIGGKQNGENIILGTEIHGRQPGILVPSQYYQNQPTKMFWRLIFDSDVF